MEDGDDLGRVRIISIHALLAESDRQRELHRQDILISIHALLAESDTDGHASHVPFYPFLSTLSLRRATCVCEILRLLWKNFYPRSPCGERLVHLTLFNRTINISIHALLAESDWLLTSISTSRRYFYPRSPCGERHDSEIYVGDGNFISIHALLAESDSLIFPPVDTSSVISIHALLAESD